MTDKISSLQIDHGIYMWPKRLFWEEQSSPSSTPHRIVFGILKPQIHEWGTY